MLSTLRPARCYQHGAAGPWTVVTLIAGSKRWSLLIAGDEDVMFMTRSVNVTLKTTEQHLIVRSDKSVAYVTNDKKLRSTFCTIEANYWQTRSIARLLCDSRASFLPPPRSLCICLGVLVCLWGVLFTNMYKFHQMFWRGNPCVTFMSEVKSEYRNLWYF